MTASSASLRNGDDWPAPASGNRHLIMAELLAQVARALKEEPPRPPEPATRVTPDRVLLAPEEAGELLGIGRTTIYSLIKAGDLESVQIGRLRRIPTSAVHEFAARLIKQQRDESA